MKKHVEKYQCCGEPGDYCMEYRFRSCVWEITLKCSFSCMYCGSKAGESRDNELTTEECLTVNS